VTAFTLQECACLFCAIYGLCDRLKCIILSHQINIDSTNYVSSIKFWLIKLIAIDQLFSECCLLLLYTREVRQLLLSQVIVAMRSWSKYLLRLELTRTYRMRYNRYNYEICSIFMEQIILYTKASSSSRWFSACAIIVSYNILSWV
jgi:hypothetical protein